MLRISGEIGVDFGTSALRVWVRSKGIVFNAPMVVAVSDDGSVGAVGDEVRRAELADSPAYSVVRPIRESAMVDLEVVGALLRWIMDSFSVRPQLLRPTVIISIPGAATAVERRAVVQTAREAGVRKVYLVGVPLAAALGMQLPITGPRGHLVVDIGEGCTDAGIVCSGRTVLSRTGRVGGSSLKAAVARWLRSNRGVQIEEEEAEEVQLSLGKALAGTGLREMKLRGRTAADGGPQTITVSARELCSIFRAPLDSITGTIRALMEEATPELAADIASSGVFLSGGVALFEPLRQQVKSEFGLPIEVAKEPRLTVIRGIARTFDNLRELRDGMRAELA